VIRQVSMDDYSIYESNDQYEKANFHFNDGRESVTTPIMYWLNNSNVNMNEKLSQSLNYQNFPQSNNNHNVNNNTRMCDDLLNDSTVSLPVSKNVNTSNKQLIEIVYDYKEDLNIKNIIAKNKPKQHYSSLNLYQNINDIAKNSPTIERERERELEGNENEPLILSPQNNSNNNNNYNNSPLNTTNRSQISYV
jgi:hypothetical protein